MSDMCGTLQERVFLLSLNLGVLTLTYLNRVSSSANTIHSMLLSCGVDSNSVKIKWKITKSFWQCPVSVLATFVVIVGMVLSV